MNKSSGRTHVGQALQPPLPKHGPRGCMLASNGRKTLLDKTMMGPLEVPQTTLSRNVIVLELHPQGTNDIQHF